MIRMKTITQLAAIVVLTAAHVVAQESAAAIWKDLEAALPRHGTSTFQATPPTPSAAIDWQSVMEKTEGLMVRGADSAVEPFAMFYVANFQFETGRLDEAMALYDTIRQKFPKHALVTASLTKDTKPLLVQAIEDCASEIAWRKKYARPPMQVPVLNEKHTATLHLSAGDVTIAFFDNVAPNHTKNFDEQVAAGRFDGTKVGRIMAETVVNLGDQATKADPTAQPTGRAPQSQLPSIAPEYSNLSHTRGMVAMSRNMGANESSATQFQIILKDQPHLDFQQTIFGKVISGLEVVDQISKAMKNQFEVPAADVMLKGITMKKP